MVIVVVDVRHVLRCVIICRIEHGSYVPARLERIDDHEFGAFDFGPTKWAALAVRFLAFHQCTLLSGLKTKGKIFDNTCHEARHGVHSR